MSELCCGLAERGTVSPLLQECITQEGSVKLRAVDYAYYLLLHHYEAFVQVGITFEKYREAYLEDYAKGIEARKGQQPRKEKQDEIVQLFLDSLRNVELIVLTHCRIS